MLASHMLGRCSITELHPSLIILKHKADNVLTVMINFFTYNRFKNYSYEEGRGDVLQVGENTKLLCVIFLIIATCLYSLK